MVPAIVAHACVLVCVLLALCWQVEPVAPAWSIVPLLIAVIGWRRRWAPLLLTLGLAWLLGASMIASRLADRLVPLLEGQSLRVTGRVVSLPEPIAHGTRFLFQPVAEAVLPERVQVGWYGDATAPAAGEYWELELRMRSVRGLINPGARDSELAAFVAGIGARASARAGRRLAPAPDDLLAWRARIVARVQQACAGHASCGVVQGLAVGHAGAIPTAAWQRYRATGTVHLIAISGLHVTLFALVVHLLVRRAWSCWPQACVRIPAPIAAAACALAAATLYALLAGFGVPARRTLCMLTVACVGLMLRREVRTDCVLAAAAVAVLVGEPLAVLASGFWLSFLGVAVLCWTARQPLPVWRATLQAQTAASIGLAPVLALAFGLIPLAGWPANLLAIPVFNLVAVPLAVAGALLSDWLPGIAGGCFLVAAHSLAALDQALAALAILLPELPVSAVGPMAGLLAVLGAALWLGPRGLPGRALVPILGLPLLYPVLPAVAPGQFELRVLDVGQGLAVVVTTGHHTLLYDAGPAWGRSDAGQTVVIPVLDHRGRRPDLVLSSHADADHAGGLISVRRRWPRVPVLAGEPHDRVGPAQACRSGQSWTWGGVRFRILHPATPRGRGNAVSCVLSIQGAAGSALLTGDLTAAAETALRVREPRLAHAVLVSPHHGSAGSSTPEFVRAVRPGVVIHAAGHRNRWGFPRDRVVERYRAIGARQFITGRDGMLTVHFAAGEPSVVSARARRRGVWRLP